MADEADARERADDATDAERGGEDSDTRFADPEEIDRDDDEHHAEGAPHARLRAEQPHQEPHGPVPRQLALPRSSCSTPTRGAGGPAIFDGRMPATATNERTRPPHRRRRRLQEWTPEQEGGCGRPEQHGGRLERQRSNIRGREPRGVRASYGARAQGGRACARRAARREHREPVDDEDGAPGPSAAAPRHAAARMRWTTSRIRSRRSDPPRPPRSARRTRSAPSARTDAPTASSVRLEPTTAQGDERGPLGRVLPHASSARRRPGLPQSSRTATGAHRLRSASASRRASRRGVASVQSARAAHAAAAAGAASTPRRN